MMTKPQITSKHPDEPGMSLTDFALLTDLLANLYADSADARRVLTLSSVPVVEIDLTGSPRRMWWNFMGYAIHQLNHMLNVVKFAAKEFQNHTTLNSYLKKIEFELFVSQGDVTLSPSPENQKNIWTSIKKIFKKDHSSGHTAKSPSYTVPRQNEFWKSFEVFENFLRVKDALALITFNDQQFNAVCLPDGYILAPKINESIPDSLLILELILPPDSNSNSFARTNLTLDKNFLRNNKNQDFTILKRQSGTAHAAVKMDISKEHLTQGKRIQIIGYSSNTEFFILNSVVADGDDHTILIPIRMNSDINGAAVIHNQKLVGMIIKETNNQSSYHTTAKRIHEILKVADLEI